MRGLVLLVSAAVCVAFGVFFLNFLSGSCSAGSDGDPCLSERPTWALVAAIVLFVVAAVLCVRAGMGWRHSSRGEVPHREGN